MSTACEIEAAIRALPPAEREKLVRDLPALLPELDGDAEWKRIIEDPRARPGLSRRFDELEAEYAKQPEAFAEMRGTDFDQPK